MSASDADLATYRNRAEDALRRLKGGSRALTRTDADELMVDLCHWIEEAGGDVEKSLADAGFNWRSESPSQPDSR